MEHPEKRYYKWNRFFLLATGLWPYQSVWSARLNRGISIVIILCMVFVQLNSIFTINITREFMVIVVEVLAVTIGILYHLFAHMRHIDKYKQLFDHMWQDWALQKTNYEIRIMHQYANITKLVTFYYALLMYGVEVTYFTWLFMPEILDVVSPLNESRPRKQPFDYNFFIDEEQYFYFIRFLIFIGCTFVPIIFLATSTLFLAFTQHVCAMYKLLGYNSAWYDAVISEQNSLLLMMRRCLHPLVLTACKFYVMSLQSFGMYYYSITVLLTISSVFTSELNMDFVIESLPMFVPTVGNLCQLYSRIFYVDKIKELLEHMWNDWALEKTDIESKIMHQYAKTTRLVMIYHSLLLYIIVTAMAISMFLPEIFVILPVNKSSQRLEAIHMEFYLDKERYIYLIMSCVCIVLFLVPLVFLASSSLYLVLTQHVCSMCEVLGFVNTIETCHTIPFLMDLVGVVITISFWLIQILTIFENVKRACASIGLIIASLCYLAIPNYMGQKVTDMTSSICEKFVNQEFFNLTVFTIQELWSLTDTILLGTMQILQMGVSYCMFMRKMMTILTSELTLEFLTSVLPMILPTLGFMMQMYLRIRFIDKLKKLFEYMWDDWALQKTHDEIKIMYEHAETTKLWTLGYFSFYYLAITIYSVWLFTPEILDIISPINESRPRIQLSYMRFELFIDEDRYFYFIRFYICIMSFVTPLISMACSTLFVVFTQHVCAMCELLGFIGTINSYYTVPCLMDLILSAVKIEQAIRSIILTSMLLCHMFMHNYMGDKVTDKSSNLSAAIIGIGTTIATIGALIYARHQNHVPQSGAINGFSAIALKDSNDIRTQRKPGSKVEFKSVANPPTTTPTVLTPSGTQAGIPLHFVQPYCRRVKADCLGHILFADYLKRIAFVKLSRSDSEAKELFA
ncbi:hypothetical protein EAG_09576 [Camponotus floridanus]|uniref:Uncharacterized protein n=1 Tax=Camponotus floridanus TaxID=104421 RepID=E2ARF4_CAMFO|nr:hypothetical protein EAG_09576 [Camponotus floridanus]